VRAALLAALALLLTAPLRAQDCADPDDLSWTIRSFEADYTVRVDGTIGVIERIAVDFGDLSRHGIYREIPVRYRRLVREDLPIPAGQVRVGLEVERVVSETGRPYEVKVTNEGANRRIRIGSPDFCVTGRNTYVIHYQLSRGVGFFGDHDELYWQVTGTGWPVTIGRARATVTLPPARAASAAGRDPWGAWCYAGGPSSTSSVGCTATFVEAGSYAFETTAPLEAGEGLTFAAAFPKGVIEGPAAAERAGDALLRYGPLAIPLVVLGLMAGLWRRHGRDPRAGSVVPRWDPPDELRPGPAGTLVDQKADLDDVIATILDLAVRGWVEIREVSPRILPDLDDDSFAGRILEAIGARKDDWEIVRKREGTEGLEPFEREVLTAVLGYSEESRRLSDLKHEFYRDLPDIREALYGELVERGYFKRSPDATRKIWFGIGAGTLAIGGMLGVVAGISQGIWLVLPAMIVCGIVVLVFASFMPAATRAGARVARDVRGLEEYIRRAEKAELEWSQAPGRSPELFEKLLPYAIALDATDVWVEQFEGVLQRPPDWYHGRTTPGTWNMRAFHGGLADFRTTAAATLPSAPGSSSGSGSFGGGSVGGGGGGGGGGSW